MVAFVSFGLVRCNQLPPYLCGGGGQPADGLGAHSSYDSNNTLVDPVASPIEPGIFTFGLLTELFEGLLLCVCFDPLPWWCFGIVFAHVNQPAQIITVLRILVQELLWQAGWGWAGEVFSRQSDCGIESSFCTTRSPTTVSFAPLARCLLSVPPIKFSETP